MASLEIHVFALRELAVVGDVISKAHVISYPRQPFRSVQLVLGKQLPDPEAAGRAGACAGIFTSVHLLFSL